VTRKDYILIAQALKDAHTLSIIRGPHDNQLSLYADTMARALSRTNSAFDRSKFLKACGVEP